MKKQKSMASDTRQCQTDGAGLILSQVQSDSFQMFHQMTERLLKKGQSENENISGIYSLYFIINMVYNTYSNRDSGCIEAVGEK